jgi:two-component system sensor histidine kinase KdpD
MDLDALLARRPSVALVDELAHTNAPGSRHAKRYEDIQELLRAGIHVISTLNIQHLESLYDLVEKATGVKVKERIPDYVLGMADQLVNVDLSAEDLQERLLGGKVYPRERIQAALENFFTPANLNRLRELALGEIAQQLDRRQQQGDRGDTARGQERVMVCISSRSPSSDTLLRKGARMAARLNAPWYVVYVKTPRETLELVDAATQRQIFNTLDLARKLGAIVFDFKGNDVVSTIAAFVQEYGITHLLLGRSRQPWYRRWFGRSLLDRLLRSIHGVDITVVDHM